MNTAPESLALAHARDTCLGHAEALHEVLASIAPRRPLSAATLADLDDDAVQDIDQFVLRFGKLQDVLGTRLFPALLDVLQESYEDRPMLDKLNRLEKLGLLESTEAWEKLRALRNHIQLLPFPGGRGGQTSALTRHSFFFSSSQPARVSSLTSSRPARTFFLTSSRTARRAEPGSSQVLVTAAFSAP